VIPGPTSPMAPPDLAQVLPAMARAFPVQIVPPSPEYREAQLIADLGPDAKGRGRRLELTFLPRDADDPYFLQYFVLMPFQMAPGQAADLARTLALVNLKMPFGHFGMDEASGWVYFRSVSICPAVPLDEGETVRTANVCAFLVDQLAGVVEPVADGSGTVEAAAQAYHAMTGGSAGA